MTRAAIYARVSTEDQSCDIGAAGWAPLTLTGISVRN